MVPRPPAPASFAQYEMESWNAAGGRGLAFGKLFDQSGELVATVAQEGLIRPMWAKPGAAKRLPGMPRARL